MTLVSIHIICVIISQSIIFRKPPPTPQNLDDLSNNLDELNEILDHLKKKLTVINWILDGLCNSKDDLSVRIWMMLERI